MMLMLLFSLGNSQYAVPAREVVEVTPMVSLETISMAPDYIAGLFSYRGSHVPVIDLCKLITDRHCENSITTRIILAKLVTSSGSPHTLGLLAEHVTETIAIDPEDFSSTGVDMRDAPFLGQATHTENGLIQRVSIAELLPDPVQALLFPAETG